MSAGIQSAIAKLKHKDVRQRRRAVRVLFEADDPRNLHAFTSLLEDEDGWFRSKAVEAFRLWAPHHEPEVLKPLVSSERIETIRAASTILEKMNSNVEHYASELLKKNDTTTVKFSASYIAKNGTSNLVKSLTQSDKVLIRREISKSKALEEDELKKLILDEDNEVYMNSIKQISERGMNLDEEEISFCSKRKGGFIHLMPFLEIDYPEKFAEITNMLSQKEEKEFLKLFNDFSSSKDEKSLKMLIDNGNKSLISRFIARKQGSFYDNLREELIFDNGVDIVQRCRLVETLLGRPNDIFVKNLVKKIIDSDSHILLKQEAEMLSTASTEV